MDVSRYIMVSIIHVKYMVSILVSICIILINVKYMVSMLVYEEY